MKQLASLLLLLASMHLAYAQAPSGATIVLPKPYATPAAKKISKVIGWPTGKVPTAPAGFAVREFAAGLDNPRWAYILPNGDVLVAESRTLPHEPSPTEKTDEEETKRANAQRGASANRITLLRDADGDGIAEFRNVFLTGLNQPFGMALVGNTFYVANTDALLSFPYVTGQTSITSPGQKILSLPAGGYNNHWTRNLLASPDGSKLYISVGSGSNVAEHGMENEVRRANILELTLSGAQERVLATGLRNPVGMDWNPVTGDLWTAVNERDNLGDELVPDYITSVQPGAFYGWPYSYYGQHEDPRLKGQRPDLVAKAIPPDVPTGAHTASLGLVFYKGSSFPAYYQGGAFVGQHGSWNRATMAGYKVIFIPFKEGKPSDASEDFLTGFIADEAKQEVYGRPVGVSVLPTGALLVTDDAGNKLWWVGKP